MARTAGRLRRFRRPPAARQGLAAPDRARVDRRARRCHGRTACRAATGVRTRHLRSGWSRPGQQPGPQHLYTVLPRCGCRSGPAVRSTRCAPAHYRRHHHPRRYRRTRGGHRITAGRRQEADEVPGPARGPVDAPMPMPTRRVVARHPAPASCAPRPGPTRVPARGPVAELRRTTPCAVHPVRRDAARLA